MRYLACGFAAVVCLLGLGCGSSDSNNPSPATNLQPAAGGGDAAASTDPVGGDPSSVSSDAGVDASAASDAAAADKDAGVDLLTPQPPAGAVKCGSGSFTQSDAVLECQSGATYFGSMATASCGGLAMGSGIWEAWCLPTSTYVWAKFRDVRASGTVSCKYWMVNPMYRAGSGGGSTGLGGGNGYKISAPTGDISEAAADLAIWVTIPDKAPAPTKGASLYAGVNPDVFTGSACKTTPTGNHLMLGAAATWTK